MKIAINAHMLAFPSMRGWNRYTANLIAALSKLGVDLTLYGDLPIHVTHRARLSEDVRVTLSPTMRYMIWEQSWLPAQCARDGIDILHSPYNYGLPMRCACA